jgi:N-acetylglucosamine-6-sulfatase
VPEITMSARRRLRPLPVGALVLAGVLTLALTLGAPHGARGAQGTSASAKPPNIVLFVTDDETLADFSARTMPETKQLLAKPGTTFTDAIVTTPLCCPSRASMLTGQYGHNHGVLSNQLGYKALVDKENVLPAWLQGDGYRTAHFGKFLNGFGGFANDPAAVAPGWDAWYTQETPRRYYGYTLAVNGHERQYGMQDRDYLGRVINADAARFVRRYAPLSKPLYLQIDQFQPHTEEGKSKGGRCGGNAVPDPRDLDLFSDEPLPRPPSFNEADVSDKPSFIQGRDRLDSTAIKHIRKRYRCRQASLRSADRGVAKVFEEFKDAGELAHTVFVFTDDNGYFLGEHRIRVNKTFPYEEALRVPLVIRAPKRYAGSGDRVVKAKRPVANIDLAPTILDLANAQPCPPGGGDCRVMDGRSLVPLLRGGPGDFPRDRGLALEYALGKDIDKVYEPCSYQGVRVPGDVYVEYQSVSDPVSGQCEPDDEREFYDLSKDPFQLDNIDGVAQSSAELALKARMHMLADCAGIAGRDPQVDGHPHCE